MHIKIAALTALAVACFQVNSPLPSTILAGVGTPASNGYACNAGTASASSASQYDQRDILTGSSIWKCALGMDGVTYSWQAPFSTPILGTSVSIGGAALLLGGTASGTATVTGAVVGSSCIATTSHGTFVPNVNISCNVTSAGTATVTLEAFIAGTPSAKTYNIRVIP